MSRAELIKKFSDYVYYFNAYCTSDAEDHEMLKAVLSLLKEQDERIKKYEHLFHFLGIGFREWATKIIEGEAEVICEVDEHERETIIRFRHI